MPGEDDDDEVEIGKNEDQHDGVGESLAKISKLRSEYEASKLWSNI